MGSSVGTKEHLHRYPLQRKMSERGRSPLSFQYLARFTFPANPAQLEQCLSVAPKTHLSFRSLHYYRDWETDRKSTRLNSSHSAKSRMPSSA